MINTRRILSNTSIMLVLIAVGAIGVGVLRASGQERTEVREQPSAEQWEYLAVAGPSTSNLTPTGNPRMRKEPNVPFGREAFVLEQHLDKLGAKGWELVAVAGPATDPAYYFKRRKVVTTD
jgi:hypothetical protein